MKFSSTNPMLSENSIVSHSDSVAMSKGQIMTLVAPFSSFVG